MDTMTFWGLLLMLALAHSPSAAFSMFSMLERPRLAYNHNMYMGQWCSTKVVVDIPANPAECYSLFSNLEAHPRWSPWLRSVVFDPQSRCRWLPLGALGWTITWKAVNTIEEPSQRIQWESLTGLSNKGLVVFTSKADGITALELTVFYNVPTVIAKVLGAGLVQALIRTTLKADVQRFSKALLQDLQGRRPKAAVEES